MGLTPSRKGDWARFFSEDPAEVEEVDRVLSDKRMQRALAVTMLRAYGYGVLSGVLIILLVWWVTP